MVPRPKPEKKVNPEAKNAKRQITKYSIIQFGNSYNHRSGTNIEFYFIRKIPLSGSRFGFSRYCSFSL